MCWVEVVIMKSIKCKLKKKSHQLSLKMEAKMARGRHLGSRSHISGAVGGDSGLLLVN